MIFLSTKNKIKHEVAIRCLNEKAGSTITVLLHRSTVTSRSRCQAGSCAHHCRR